MNDNEIDILNNQILELVNAAAQEWQSEEESRRLLEIARDVARKRNRLLKDKK